MDGRPSPVALLARLKAIGPQIGAVLYHEGLYRNFANRRDVAAYAGLVPTPWRSGSIDREQGISKAGNPRLRHIMIELAWLWVRHQPGSALSGWFRARVGNERGRIRRISASRREAASETGQCRSRRAAPRGVTVPQLWRGLSREEARRDARFPGNQEGRRTGGGLYGYPHRSTSTWQGDHRLCARGGCQGSDWNRRR